MKDKLHRYMTRLKYDREQILSSSLAFVTVSTKHEKRALIHIRSRKSTPYIYTFELFKSLRLLLKRCLGMKFTEENREPYRILEAPPPEDLRWKFIGATKEQRFTTQILSFTCSAVMFYGAFVIQSLVKFGGKYMLTLGPSLLEANPYLLIAWQLSFMSLSSLTILVINKALEIFNYSLVRKEKHMTISDFNLSLIKKNVVSHLINMIAVPIMVHITFPEMMTISNVLSTVLLSSVFGGIFRPILDIFSPKYFLKKRKVQKYR